MQLKKSLLLDRTESTTQQLNNSTTQHLLVVNAFNWIIKESTFNKQIVNETILDNSVSVQMRSAHDEINFPADCAASTRLSVTWRELLVVCCEFVELELTIQHSRHAKPRQDNPQGFLAARARYMHSILYFFYFLKLAILTFSRQ